MRWGVVTGVVLTLVVLVFGVAPLAIRAELSTGLVCQVTQRSIRSNPDGYTGGDHTADPKVGEWYSCDSGGLSGERVCHLRTRRLLWTERVDCLTFPG